VLTPVTEDVAYRQLAEQVLRGACEAADIELAGVEFGERDREASRSWLCFVVDPKSDDHAAANTMSTAADHFALIDPNGIQGEAGRRIAARVYEIELAPEASLQVRDGSGSTQLISPWQKDLAVARVSFTYSVA
jgi:hypothetical protein